MKSSGLDPVAQNGVEYARKHGQIDNNLDIRQPERDNPAIALNSLLTADYHRNVQVPEEETRGFRSQADVDHPQREAFVDQCTMAALTRSKSSTCTLS